MRVALDVTPLLGARTGVGQSVQGVLDALPEAAPEVEVLPFVLSARASRAGLPPGARRFPVPAAALVRAWGRVDVPTGDRWLGGADVVHGSNFVVPPMRRAPTTLTVHDCWCARNPSACPPEIVAFTAAVRRAVARGAWVHVTTTFGAGEVRDLYSAERVAIVPFGVPPVPAEDAPTVRAAVGGAPFVLALAGTIDPRKGIDVLVRAYGLVAPERPELRLVVTGADGSGRTDVDAAIASLPVEVAKRVLLLGRVSDAVRAALLSAAVVLAYPSRYEGFGFPLLEAMAAGTPVVASDAGAIPEVAGEAARLTPAGDADALAQALARVVDDGTRQARMARAGRARAASYPWSTTARGLADLWRRALDS